MWDKECAILAGLKFRLGHYHRVFRLGHYHQVPIDEKPCADVAIHDQCFIHAHISSEPSILPAGIELKVVRWNKRDGGREFHARYVLTELGGISFDPGLDEGDEGELTKMDLIEPELHSELWADFVVDVNSIIETTYEFSDAVIVTGKA